MLLLLSAVACAPHPEPVPGAPNILLVLLDDVGQDGIAAYDVSPMPPVTPVLDGLAAEGVRFTRAYAYPSCKPSRGALLTGRYVRSG
ncbi:MAG: sulfatase-like hydrolase/transferase, partial [Myxococcota bacterium]